MLTDMSTYVMSDIHGCYDEFIKMIEIIELSPEDTLIIAGDYMDRGKQSYEMLEWISNAPENVILLKGNHDAEFVEYIRIMNSMKKKLISKVDDDSVEHTRKLFEIAKDYVDEHGAFFDYYGNIHELIFKKKITLRKFKEWSDIIKQLPYTYETSIDEKNYIIVHAGYIEEENLIVKPTVESFYLYARDEAYRFGGRRDSVVIAGHTPTISPNHMTYTGGTIYKYYNEKINCTFYDIDCGAVFRSQLGEGNMACLRLDDEKEFYLYE